MDEKHQDYGHPVVELGEDHGYRFELIAHRGLLKNFATAHPGHEPVSRLCPEVRRGESGIASGKLSSITFMAGIAVRCARDVEKSTPALAC